MLTLHEAATMTRGTLLAAGGAPADAALGSATLATVSTDSRSVPTGALFVALSGARFDGHAFVDAVAAGGACAALAERPAATLPTIVVGDSRRALGDLALGWRSRFAMPVVAVTGSNGKTTTKEMLASILAAEFGAHHRLATRGNLNNEIGVPLTLLELRSHHRAAVVELGMNHPGETARLAQVAQPTVALVVNAQREHQEFMKSVAAVADEHALAIAGLAADGVAVFPADDLHADVWRRAAGARRVVDFVCLTAKDAVVPRHRAAVIGRAYLEDDDTILHLDAPSDALTARLAVTGIHNACNATAAAAAAIAAGISLGAVRDGLEAFRPLPGRSHRITLDDGTTIVDDSYNANPDSMRAAIDHLASLPGRRLMVVGDMGEVGDAGARFHAEVGEHAKSRGIDGLLALGAASRAAVDAFGPGAEHFAAIEPLIEATRAWLAAADGSRAVAIKGSRFMRMERVVAALTGVTAAAVH